MPTTETLMWFLGAAAILAAIPGPGQLFIVSRTLSSGRRVGFASCAGTALGGLVHVVAGAIGLSAIIMASATAFTVVKLVGGAYLVFLGIQEWRSANASFQSTDGQESSLSAARQAVVVEATNPKTAMFFLALIPQFVDPASGPVALQFGILGLLSIALNTGMGLLVATIAGAFRAKVTSNGKLLQHVRRGSGSLLVGLGGYLLLARRAA